MNGLTIRFAHENEVGLVLEYIRRIARYEKLENQVEATEEGLRQSLFVQKQAEVLLAFVNSEPIGFALFFHNFSTFVGRAGLYLEDLYVDQQVRGQGYGKALFMEVARIARSRNCKRMEWCALNWNRPAIDFYLSLGAHPMNQWTTFRLTAQELDALK